MSSNRKFFAVAGALAGLSLSACGFSPLYGDDGQVASVQSRLQEVKIANIPERTGQLLSEALEAQMQTDGASTNQLYVLNVSFNVGQSAIGVQEDSSTTRVRFIGTANWSLSPIGAPNVKLASGQADTEDALNVIDQQYFAQSLETSTVNRQVAQEIGGQIAQQVAIYFKSHPNAE